MEIGYEPFKLPIHPFLDNPTPVLPAAVYFLKLRELGDMPSSAWAC